MRKLVYLSALLAGCASQPETAWHKPGTTQADFNADMGFCRAQAFGVPGATQNMMQVAIVQRSCMEGKGWQLVAK